MRFAKGGLDGVLVRVHTTSGKSDLPGVRPQMLASNGEDEARRRTIRHRDEDCGRDVGAGADLRQVALHGWLARFGCKCLPQPLGETHVPFSSGKNAPSLQTPGGVLSSPSAISTSS